LQVVDHARNTKNRRAIDIAAGQSEGKIIIKRHDSMVPRLALDSNKKNASK
jgi:hypothetical protein